MLMLLSMSLSGVEQNFFSSLDDFYQRNWEDLV